MKLPNWFKWAFNTNYWIWFHIFAGAIFSKIGLLINLKPVLTIILVSLGSITWELIEWKMENQIKIYGSIERAFWDAFGDVSGAIAISAIIVF